MHVQKGINPGLLAHLFKMVADGAIVEADVKAFVKEPSLWRKPSEVAQAADGGQPPVIYTPATAQSFWQGVYDELGIEVTVPPVPKLTKNQLKSLAKFGFMLAYIPAITEEQYPVCFVKPEWGKYLTESSIERIPLTGKWVAVETIRKPHFDDPSGYPDDLLMSALKRPTRFKTSHDDLTGGLLSQIAKVTGFPMKGTRLPTAEEWKFIGNLFNWLREHCGMDLPDLGSTRSRERCQNSYGSASRLIAGNSENGGLADVDRGWRDDRYVDVSFRVLAVL